MDRRGRGCWTWLRGGYGIFYTGHLLNPFRNDLQNTFPYAQD